MSTPIGIVGQGAWGAALASSLRTGGAEVIAWRRGDNPAPLGSCDPVLLAVPAQATRQVLTALAAQLNPTSTLVLTAKGLETETFLRQSQIVSGIAPSHPVAVLSGPSFAADLVRGLPTAVALATDRGQPEALQRRLATPSLRPYLTQDLAGVELGGALKNVIAIACGVAIGAGLGESARAALMARGFAEIVRIGLASGAEAATLSGLGGLGDLVLTSTSDLSRNFRYGRALGSEGRALRTGTYEGVATAQAAQQLSDQLGLDCPIIATVAALVEGRCAVQEAVRELYSRPLRRE